MTSHWKAVLGVVLIYLFGCFSGFISTSIFARHKLIDLLQHPGIAISAALEKRMTGNLHLDADQKQKIHEYFLENLDQRRTVQKQIQPQIQALNQTTFQQISTVLNPDQRDIFHDNVERFRRRLSASALGKEADNLIPLTASSVPSATNPAVGSPPPQ
jgi:hypothetical protein